MTFPDLKTIGFGPASHRDVLRLLAFLYCDPQKVEKAGKSFSRRQRVMIILAVYMHSLPYILIVSNIIGCIFFSFLKLPTSQLLIFVDRITVENIKLTAFGLVFGPLIGLVFGRVANLFRGLVLCLTTGLVMVSLAVNLYWGLTDGVFWGLVGGLYVGFFLGLGSGLIDYTRYSLVRGLFSALTVGLVLGLFGVLMSLILGYSYGLALGLGLGCAGGSLVSYVRPYYLPWNLLLLFFGNLRLFRLYHPIFWDHACPVPFPALDKLLTAYAEQEPEDGARQIEQLITGYPSQRQAALRAKTVLIARSAAQVAQLTELTDILDELPEGDKGYLAQTASLRDRAMAICRQQIYLESTNRPFFREHAVRQLRSEINSFYTQVGGFHEPLASEFRRAAENWLRLTDVQLSEAAAQRSREMIPQLFRAGDPVLPDSEAFVAQHEFIAALEHEIMAGPGCPGILLYGRRRLGKSTIIRNVDRFLPETVMTLVVSMQNAAAFTSEVTFSTLLAREIGRVYPAARQESEPTNLKEFYEFLTSVDGLLTREGRRLLLSIDEYEEIDIRIGSGVFSQDFPAMLRESVQSHRRITWLFTGSHHFSELRNVRWSSYLVSLRTIELTTFTPEETRLLLTEPMKHSKIPHAQEAGGLYGPLFWGDGGVGRIHEETGGWPHLVQLVASTVVDLCNQKGLDRADAAVLDNAFAKAVVSGDTVLAELMLYGSEEHEAAWRYLIGFRTADTQPPPADVDLGFLLKRYLLVGEADSGNWVLRVPLMYRWLRGRQDSGFYHLQKLTTSTTIFTSSQKNLSDLSPAEALKLFRNLLWCEAQRTGLSAHNVLISLNETVADGGIDARVDGSPSADSILINGQVFFQLKAGTSFKPWQPNQLKKELFGKSTTVPTRDALGEAIRNCLDNNGRYVLVVFGHDLTEPQQRGTKQQLEEMFQQIGFPSPQVEVLGQGQLLGLLVPYPSLGLELLGRSELQFQTLDSWRMNDDMRPVLKPGAAQTQFIEEVRATFSKGDFQHIRVIGEPGIGKSRLVLEAVSSDDLAPTVMYVANGDDFQKGHLFNELLRPDRQYVVTLVVDDCGERDRASIWRTLKGRAGIKLVTMDHGPEESADSSMKVFYCPPLEKEQVAEIIAGYIGPRHENSNWAEWCDGSPRVAHAVGDNLQRNPDDILKPPATVPIWDRFVLGHQKIGEREAEEHLLILRHIALFRRFGFDAPVDHEARFISDMIQTANPAITWSRFQSIVQHHRKRRVLQGQKTLFIVPKALHVYLWLGFWEQYGRGFEFKDFIERMPESLNKWFMELFIYAHGSAVARELVKKVLSLEDGPFSCNEFLTSEAGTGFLSVLAEADPHATLSLLNSTFGIWTHEQLLQWETGWQHIVWALEKIAVWEDTFTGAARLLSKMALADHTSYGNNSKGTFLSLFMSGVGWAPTQAPPELRFPIIVELMKCPDSAKKELGLQACKSWLSTYGGSRIVGVEYQGLRPTIQFWRPKTYGELFDGLLKIWNFVWEESLGWKDSDKEMAYKTLLESAPGLVQITSISDRILDTILLMASEPVADKKSIIHFVIHQLKYGAKDLSEEIIDRLNSLDALLTGDSFRERFNRYVLFTDSDEDYDFVGEELKDNPIPSERVQRLAEEAASQPEIIDELLELFVNSEGRRLYEFGNRLSNATGYSLINRIIETQESALPNLLTQFTGGYLAGVKGQNSEEWEKVMLSLLASDVLRPVGVDLVFRTGATEKIVYELIRFYRERKVASQAFSRFGLFSDEDQLSQHVVAEILKTLSEQPDERALSIVIEFADYYYCKDNKNIELPEALIYNIITMEEVFKQNQQTMVGYHWHRLVTVFRRQFPHRDMELFEHIITRLNSSLRAVDYGCRIADDIARDHPNEVWEIVARNLDKGEECSWYISSWLEDETDFDEKSTPGAICIFEPETVMRWVKDEPKKRVKIIAGCLPKTLNSNEGGTLTRMFLEEYGDDKKTADRLISHFWSGGWSGPESIYRSKQREVARRWLSEIESPKIRAWLTLYIENLSTIIERRQIDEERGY